MLTAVDPTGQLSVATRTVADTVMLTADGLLDSTTYLWFRDRIIKAALDEPRAVVADVTALTALSGSAWAVFTSARWHVSVWPDVPVLLVCSHAAGRRAVTRNGVTRYVPVYPSTDRALLALERSEPPKIRRRARAVLPRTPASLAMSRGLVERWLAGWDLTEYSAVVKVITTTLVENVLQHTEGEPVLRLETNGAVTVAVSDTSHSPARVAERILGTGAPSGLTIVAALSRRWGNAPTSSGKTVWVIVGPENRL